MSTVASRSAFWPLPEVHHGAVVEVVGTNGQTTTWSVSSIEQMPKADPPSSFWTGVGPPKLALVTCGGTFNDSISHYDDNVVV